MEGRPNAIVAIPRLSRRLGHLQSKRDSFQYNTTEYKWILAYQYIPGSQWDIQFDNHTAEQADNGSSMVSLDATESFLAEVCNCFWEAASGV